MKTYCTYNYISTKTLRSLESIDDLLRSWKLNISHAGKNDPPRKFDGSINDLGMMILDGNDLTNYTFLRDKDRRVELTVEIRNDVRWDHHTISMSGPNDKELEEITKSIVSSIGAYVSIIGVLKGCEDQGWKILHESHDCPKRLLDKLC